MGDLPDYTKQVVIRYEGGFIGLEELAVRLGFPGPWDLRGNIVLMDSFESEETEWTSGSSSPGNVGARSSRHKFSGDWAAKLTYVIGGLAPAAFTRYLHFPGISKYGLFCRFGIDTNCKKAGIQYSSESGARLRDAVLYYDLPTTRLYVITTGSAEYTITSSLNLDQDSCTWYPMLLTFDMETEYYDKLYFAGNEYDLSNVPIPAVDSVANPFSYIILWGDGYEVGNGYHYVDDIIVVKNVP